MGAWGSGAFENDGALGWVNDLEDAGSPVEEFIRETFTTVIEESEYLEVDDGQWTVAAAALVASHVSAGSPSTAFGVPDALLDPSWTAGDDLRQLSLRALDRVTDIDTSELPELWDGDADFENLIDRLRSALASTT